MPNGNLRSHIAPRQLPASEIKFVYAGSLFRNAKEIRRLLDVFSDLDDDSLRLYIMGYGGKWIPRHYTSPNIIYLGNLTHEEAEGYVRACDVGLLLYPAEDEYVARLSFPVKLALYVTSEVPILPLDCTTVRAFIEAHQVGLVSTLDSLQKTVLEMASSPFLLRKLRSNCKAVKDAYYLDTIFEKALASALKWESKGTPESGQTGHSLHEASGVTSQKTYASVDTLVDRGSALDQR